MRVNWTRKGRLRLQQIYDYIAADQPENALNFIDQITRHVELLADHPKQGKVVSRYQREDIREIYEGRYRIIYLIQSDQIDILTIRHGARLLPEKPGKL